LSFVIRGFKTDLNRCFFLGSPPVPR